jgi:hypothetical protein
MSRNRASRTRRLRSRLLHAPLRLKVMAGVVVVTLLALTAFDVGVVITMRRYLVLQTDRNLQVAFTVIRPTLSSVSEGLARPTRQSPYTRRNETIGVAPAPFKIPALPGDFDIAFVPARGPTVMLELGTTPAGVHRFVMMRPRMNKLLADPGLHTVLVGKAGPFRVLSARVKGGDLVVGTSLDEVTRTTDQIGLIVTLGSVAVLLLIGLGVFVEGCGRSRPWPARPTGSPAATSPSACPRTTPGPRWAGLAPP